MSFESSRWYCGGKECFFLNCVGTFTKKARMDKYLNRKHRRCLLCCTLCFEIRTLFEVFHLLSKNFGHIHKKATSLKINNDTATGKEKL